MVSRLILNLRGAVEEKDVFQYQHHDRPLGARETVLLTGDRLFPQKRCLVLIP